MKKLVLAAAVLAVTASSALAADMAVKAKAPPPAPFDPWDFAFGSAIMNDYIFRGVTQSNHKPSVAVYFEPRYNFTKDLQAYIGLAGESISFPNRAAAEIDIYGGIRPTFGMFAFDFGAWGYIYPGGQCFNAAAFPGSGIPGSEAQCVLNGNLPLNGNVAKRSASFYEVYGKVNITLNDQFAVGFNEYYSPNFLNLGAWGNYASITGKWTAPSTTFGSSGVGMYISGEFGRQWLGTSDAFYGVVSPLANFAARYPGAELQHLEHRRRLHLQGVHAGRPLLRHQPVEGFLQRLHLRLLDHQLQRGQHHRDQSGWLRLQLVRRDRHRQAVGRPDRGEQPEVSSIWLDGSGGGRAICRPFAL